MKKIVYIFILISFSKQIFGQTNLVPNPSFEDYYSCPTYRSELYKCKYWYSAAASPDYFNSCGNNEVDVPKNIFGYHTAASGNAYAGFAAGFVNCYGCYNVREFISVPLISPLVIGQKYFVSFKVSPAYSQGQGMFFNNNLGALFTKYKLDSTKIYAPNKYHINYSSIINDTLNWTRVKGKFIADSTYSYMTIGNLRDSASILIDSNYCYQEPFLAFYSYYYCDDVCISTDSLFAYSYDFVGIKEYDASSFYSIYPNPTSGSVFLKFNTSEKVSISVADKCGQTIISKKLFNEREIDLNGFSDGIYFLEIICDDKKYYEKIIVRH